jgi:hypothetical protein
MSKRKLECFWYVPYFDGMFKLVIYMPEIQLFSPQNMTPMIFFFLIHFFLEIWQLWPIFFFQKNPLIEKQLLFFWLQSRRKIATKKMVKFTMK